MTFEVTSSVIERWECPRHGEHSHFVQITLFKPVPPNVIARQEKMLERRYCTQCLIECMDRHKITEMEPVRPVK